MPQRTSSWMRLIIGLIDIVDPERLQDRNSHVRELFESVHGEDHKGHIFQDRKKEACLTLAAIRYDSLGYCVLSTS